MKLWRTQAEHDHERVPYDVTFPVPLPPEQVQAFFTALSTSIHRGPIDHLVGRQTIAVEAVATGNGIAHRLLIPWGIADHVTSELRHLVPGTIVTKATSRPRPLWTDVAEIHLSDSTRTIRQTQPLTVATDVLTSLGQVLGSDEMVMMQWVIAPAGNEVPPSHEYPVTSTKHGLWSQLAGTEAGKTEIDDRRTKLEHPRYHVMGRIASRANTVPRSKQVVNTVLAALKTANGHAQFYGTSPSDIEAARERTNHALTPWHFPASLNAAELTMVAGLPLGTPTTPGLPRQGSRHLFATSDVAREGRIFGMSNYPGDHRPIAQGYDVPMHATVVGKTGHGKSVFLANSIAQDMARGFGAIIIDASNSNSPESLFNRALQYIPRNRLGEAIIMDIAASHDRPVGFNLLDQGHDRLVIDQLANLMQHLYPDSQGVWTRELIYHGMFALIEHGNATLIDLLPLLRPRPEELPWVRAVIKSVKNPQVKFFMNDWMSLTDEERRKRSQPLYDRLWQLNNRPEVHDIFGQTHSAFQLREVLMNNGILFINLAGLPEDTAGLIGTLLFQALWTEAQSLTPSKPNFIYLDEVQTMTKVNIGLSDIMERGRKHQFFLTAATQHITEHLSDETRTAMVSNTGAKVLFTTTSSRDAKFWANEIGGNRITDYDIQNLPRFDAIAQIATPTTPGEPVTFTALAPFKSLGTAQDAIELSARKHGTPIAEVQQDIDARRQVSGSVDIDNRPMGRRKIDQT